jgi:uncharacterized protein YndB with AHSA1/START domain
MAIRAVETVALGPPVVARAPVRPQTQCLRWDARRMDEEQRVGLVLELHRVFHAPSERIFALLTEPAELTKWWGPHGFTTPEIELELSVGAGYRYTMQPPSGDAFHLSGEFLDIDRPQRLAYTFRWEEPDPDDRETVVILSLHAVGQATEVSLSQGEFATKERLALHRSGWTNSFEKLSDAIGAGLQEPSQ